MAPSKAPLWRVVEAEFERSATSAANCPPPDLPEIAIAGRSNVGKSSLLNAVAQRRGLARTSRTPGRTQLLNLFRITLAGPDAQRLAFRCVDLPGYGFAAAHRAVRERFAPMVESYLGQREGLRALVLLIDLRRGLGDLDGQLLAFASQRATPSLLVATKADKLGASARSLARRKVAEAVGVRPSDVVLTSSQTGAGIHERGGLIDDLADLLLESNGASVAAP